LNQETRFIILGLRFIC